LFQKIGGFTSQKFIKLFFGKRPGKNVYFNGTHCIFTTPVKLPTSLPWKIGTLFKKFSLMS